MSYRILGIAPYEALGHSMSHLAGSREDIQLDVYVGNLENGVQLVKDHEKDGYDAIISRGGTAQEISAVTSLQVISIPLSVYDILRAIRLVENYQENFAIVGFSNITEAAHLLCDLLQYRIRIITLNDEQDVENVLKSLAQDGCNMVICDIITQNVARALNMNAILITSGAESILSTFDQAVSICQSHHMLQEENSFLRSILQDSDSSTIVMSESGDIFLSTWEGEKTNEVYDMLRSDLHENIKSGGGKFFHNIGNVLYSVVARRTSYKSRKYIVYYVTAAKIPLMTGKYGIHFMSYTEVESDYFGSFYSIAGAMGGTKEKLEDIANSMYPVLTISEDGTGKKQVAEYIYLKSDKHTNPFVEVDCSMLNDRNWEYLINNYNSPFNDNDNTIYMSHMEMLSPERLKKLLSFITDTQLHKRNRLLLSSCVSSDARINAYLMDYMKRLNCLNISLPVLRGRTDEIPVLANLYLGHLNVEMGKQLIGFNPKAIRILQEYDWPSNYGQFERVLIGAATVTAMPYVSADTIAELIANEKATNVYQMLTEPAAVSGEVPKLTLSEMINGIVKRALDENKGNQSKTAKQLGISRTTLWRYIGTSK